MIFSRSCGTRLLICEMRGTWACLHALDGLEVGVAEEQALPREQLPEDDADREDVGAGVDLLPHRRLRRQVARTCP